MSLIPGLIPRVIPQGVPPSHPGMYHPVYMPSLPPWVGPPCSLLYYPRVEGGYPRVEGGYPRWEGSYIPTMVGTGLYTTLYMPSYTTLGIPPHIPPSSCRLLVLRWVSGVRDSSALGSRKSIIMGYSGISPKSPKSVRFGMSFLTRARISLLVKTVKDRIDEGSPS